MKYFSLGQYIKQINRKLFKLRGLHQAQNSLGLGLGGLPWTDIQIQRHHFEAVCLEEGAPFSNSYQLILEVGCGCEAPSKDSCWTRSTV